MFAKKLIFPIDFVCLWLQIFLKYFLYFFTIHEKLLSKKNFH